MILRLRREMRAEGGALVSTRPEWSSTIFRLHAVRNGGEVCRPEERNHRPQVRRLHGPRLRRSLQILPIGRGFHTIELRARCLELWIGFEGCLELFDGFVLFFLLL